MSVRLSLRPRLRLKPVRRFAVKRQFQSRYPRPLTLATVREIVKLLRHHSTDEPTNEPT